MKRSTFYHQLLPLFCLTISVLSKQTVIGQTGLNERFGYVGHRIGSYAFAEFVPEIYATQFNEGYAFSRSDDKAVIHFAKTNTPAQLTEKVKWGLIQNGISAGTMFDIDGILLLEAGFHQFNQKASGERIDPVHGQESFAIQSRSGGIYMNFVRNNYRWFRPYFGFEMGTFRLRYWYESADGDDVRRQSLGYGTTLTGLKNFGNRVKDYLLDENTDPKDPKPGGRPLYYGFNFGVRLQFFRYKGFALDIVPQYQMRWNRAEDIDMMETQPDLLSRHGNYSISFLLVKDLTFTFE